MLSTGTKGTKNNQKIRSSEDCKLFLLFIFFLIRMNQYAEIQFYT